MGSLAIPFSLNRESVQGDDIKEQSDPGQRGHLGRHSL